MFMTFGKMVKELRLEKDLTQAQLGAKLNLTDGAVRMWETQGVEPSFAIVIELAKIFDVTVGQLLGVEEY